MENVYDFDLIDFNYWVISCIKENVTVLSNNVLGDYPEDKPKFPLAVVSSTENDAHYAFNSAPITTEITVNVEMYHNAKTDCIRIQKAIEKVLLNVGFTRLSPTSPYKDTSSNRYKITEKFIIRYNLLKNSLERTV